MKLKLITATIAAAVAAAANLNAAGANTEVLHQHSRRSNEKEKAPGSQVIERFTQGYGDIAGYSPGSLVTDHCAIDLDQEAMEEQLAIQTPESFNNARRIYNEGGNSKPYAIVTLIVPLAADVRKGDLILGKNSEGDTVFGKSYDDYSCGSSTLKVQYDLGLGFPNLTTMCQVGALVETNQAGCLVGEGVIGIYGIADYAYVYNPESDNRNGRTIAGFSEMAQQKMMECAGCPYKDFIMFYNYYGSASYADEWISAAFDGTTTTFRNGNADFSNFGLNGMRQAIQTAAITMNIFTYVIRELEDALDDCERDCINCNDAPVHAWDEGVCLYVGSVGANKAQDATSGKLLHALADKRCTNFKTCGIDGNKTDGTSRINYELMDLFTLGNNELLNGNCSAARRVVGKITKLMYVPLIQGVLRYAYKMDVLNGQEKDNASGSVFAASVLPRIHAASPGDATVIYNNMKVGESSVDSRAVKSAFENVYGNLGISCSDVGGLWDFANDDYFPGMQPCVDNNPISTTPATAVTLEPTTYYPTYFPTKSPSPTTKTVSPHNVRDEYYCGTSWRQAIENCGQPCSTGLDDECVDELGERYMCFYYTGCSAKLMEEGPTSNTKTPSKEQPMSPSEEPTAAISGIVCEIPNSGCINGMFNQALCECECIPPFCHDVNGDCSNPSNNCGDNPWTQCIHGVNCPWWVNPLNAESCTTGPDVPLGLWNIHNKRETCCDINFPYSSMCKMGINVPTKHPTIATPNNDVYELVPIKFDVFGLPNDVEIEMMELQDEMLTVLERILLRLSDRIPGLKITSVEDNTPTRHLQKALLMPALMTDVTMYYDVYVVKEDDKQFGPMIINELRDSYDEVLEQIRTLSDTKYFGGDLDLNWCTIERPFKYPGFSLCVKETSDRPAAPTGVPTHTYFPTMSQASSGLQADERHYCGTNWMDANSSCSTPCFSGSNSECDTASGQQCFGYTGCAENLAPTPTYFPTMSPASSGPQDNENHYCGTNWMDAATSCSTPCFSGSNSECDTASGQQCVGYTGCAEKLASRSPSPTKSPVEMKETEHPVQPTLANVSPTKSPVEMKETEHPVQLTLANVPAGYRLSAADRASILRFVKELMGDNLLDPFRVVEVADASIDRNRNLVSPMLQHKRQSNTVSLPLRVVVHGPACISDFALVYVMNVLEDHKLDLEMFVKSLDWNELKNVSVSIETYDPASVTAEAEIPSRSPSPTISPVASQTPATVVTLTEISTALPTDSKMPTLAPTTSKLPTGKEPTISTTSEEPNKDPTLAPAKLDTDGGIYYPNFSNGLCLNDGSFPPDLSQQYLFHNATECCDIYFPTNMDACLQASIPTASPTPLGEKDWYPDYDNDVCKNDGAYGPFEINFFYTYEKCCESEWIDTEKCLDALDDNKQLDEEVPALDDDGVALSSHAIKDSVSTLMVLIASSFLMLLV